MASAMPPSSAIFLVRAPSKPCCEKTFAAARKICCRRASPVNLTLLAVGFSPSVDDFALDVRIERSFLRNAGFTDPVGPKRSFRIHRRECLLLEYTSG